MPIKEGSRLPMVASSDVIPEELLLAAFVERAFSDLLLPIEVEVWIGDAYGGHESDGWHYSVISGQDVETAIAFFRECDAMGKLERIIHKPKIGVNAIIAARRDAIRSIRRKWLKNQKRTFIESLRLRKLHKNEFGPRDAWRGNVPIVQLDLEDQRLIVFGRKQK